MATYEEAMQALRNAHKAGDSEAAKRLAGIAAGLKGNVQAPAVPDGMFVNPNTGQMTNRDMLKNNYDPSNAASAAGGYMQGFALGATDEIVGGMGYVEGGQDMANFRREEMRAAFEKQAEKNPVAYTAGTVAGAVTSPVAKLAPATSTVKGAAAVGGGYGMAVGFGEGEGGFAERAKNAGVGGAVGFITGGLVSAAVKGASPYVARLFKKAEERPSLATLKAAKTAAYADVRKSGEFFDSNDMTALYQRVARKAKLADLDDVADPHATAAVKMFERRAGESKITLSRLDKIRQNLWQRYNRSSEPALLDMIGEIDETVARKAGASELMGVAREANSRFAKAQLLENAFDKARLQTASTGSGGNILNKYKQAVTGIITKPHEAKWFSSEELALMRQFVEGDVPQHVLRRIGKLAPGGNGLMTALNVYAATVDPAMLAVTGVASAAKASADKGAMRGSEAILDKIATGSVIKPAGANLPIGGVGVGGSAAANSLRD